MTDQEAIVPAPEARLEGQQTHDIEVPAALREFMVSGWAPDPAPSAEPAPVAAYTAKRRELLSARFPGEALVVPSGALKVRANDTDYPFRPGSDCYWLTGETGEDAVLLLRPEGRGHQARLYVHPRSDRSSPAFYTDRRYGELWVGPRRGVAETAAALQLETAPVSELAGVLSSLGPARVLRGYDPAVDAALAADEQRDGELATALSELRLVKDDYEIARLEEAVAATARGFEDVVRELPHARGAGERWLEGTFNRRARAEGNDVGYGSICACGPHATTLHWVRNDGPVRSGELALLDMGVECRELYTADVTRTLPISGRWTEVQRRVYDVVYRAQEAALGEVRPGAEFLAPHRAAMAVIAEALEAWGLLPVPAAEALQPDNGVYRRYTLHATSHMLGLDVHDCAAARESEYRDGVLRPGMVLTVEPGLYFQPDDLTVPAELRGIGVRIEDDVLVTDTGHRNLSAALPRDPDEVQRWMAALLG